MKILLIILVLDSVINLFAKNYIKNDREHWLLHYTGLSFAQKTFMFTRALQFIIIPTIIIKFILILF